MKKTITRPDGTQETVEGTADEIAEYERKLKKESPVRGKKREILKGKEATDDVATCPCKLCVDTRKFVEEWKWTPQVVPPYVPPPVDGAPISPLVSPDITWTGSSSGLGPDWKVIDGRLCHKAGPVVLGTSIVDEDGYVVGDIRERDPGYRAMLDQFFPSSSTSCGVVARG